jgi:hypothetical protein
LPLSEKARIEVYLPDVDHPAYSALLDAFESEFTYAFGGCTLVGGLEGCYLSRAGSVMQDRVNLLYSDTPFTFEADFATLATYSDKLRLAALDALEEEAILIAVYPVFHCE